MLSIKNLCISTANAKIQDRRPQTECTTSRLLEPSPFPLPEFPSISTRISTDPQTYAFTKETKPQRQVLSINTRITHPNDLPSSHSAIALCEEERQTFSPDFLSPRSAPVLGSTVSQHSFELQSPISVSSGDRHSEDDEKSSFSCSKCSKQFSRAVHLKSHMRIHEPKRPFPCPVCSQTFLRKVWIPSNTSTTCGGMNEFMMV